MNIALGPDGGFALTLPSGRVISVPNTPHAAQFFYRILWDAQHGGSDRGYIGNFPTQAIVDRWTRDALSKERQEEFLAEKREAARAAWFKETGIEPDSIVINI
jgi:hypothetical protein